MTLPFTADQFFAVFRAYNTAMWPAVLLFWAATAIAVIAYVDRRRLVDAFVPALLAIQWLWAGVVYHGTFFVSINPAAVVFAVMFSMQAALFAWLLFTRRGVHFSQDRGVRRGVALVLAVYALLYPCLAIIEGHAYPATPTFGVPCPTAILTIGFLIAAGDTVPWFVAAIPIAWAVVGGTASFLLAVRTDLMLLVSAVVMTFDLVHRIPIGPIHHERHA